MFFKNNNYELLNKKINENLKIKNKNLKNKNKNLKNKNKNLKIKNKNYIKKSNINPILKLIYLKCL